MKRIVIFITCAVASLGGIAEQDAVPAKKLLMFIQDRLERLREEVRYAVVNGKFNVQAVAKHMKQLKDAIGVDGEKLEILDRLSSADKESMKHVGAMVLAAYRNLLEEAAVLELWTRGYAAYEHDLDDNFKKLPNRLISKPDYKKLYEQLGFRSGEGQQALFNVVRAKYTARYKDLEQKSGTEFADLVFRPFLRVLDLVWRNYLSKMQYDAYLAGQAAYDKKVNQLRPQAAAIEQLFSVDLPALTLIKGTIEMSLPAIG